VLRAGERLVKLRGQKRGETVLKAVRPSAAIEAAYRRRLLKLIDKMCRSTEYWIVAAWRADPPRMAQDATPATLLQRVVRRLSRQWEQAFDEAANDLADYFAKDVQDRSERVLKNILRRGGWTVKFRATPSMRDVLNATTGENVALIRSIPARHFQEIEGLVMRSVTAGRDLKTLTDDLQEKFGVTRRRAALIARDQNNKATATITRVRQQDLGIKEAIWLHSHAGKKPRPTHVKMDGKRFNVSQGMWDPAENRFIHPGELINCRCVSRSVVPGFM
jgi:SPP1 gp7 family putative phage head morphogenesis protein